LNAVAKNSQYIDDLWAVIGKLHGCDSKHVEFVPVHEVFQGKTAWRGVVEVFDLMGHPKAKRADAWSHLDGGKDVRTRYVAVLEVPPVVSPETAVKASIVNDAKAAREKKKGA
jgi:hypothetical protein